MLNFESPKEIEWYFYGTERSAWVAFLFFYFIRLPIWSERTDYILINWIRNRTVEILQ